MGVDQTSLDRIRNATFPSSKRGYDKQEVEKFLSRLADWLETGGGDESRSETVKRELERVGERTGAILSQAEDSAQQIRSEAEAEAAETSARANIEAEQARTEAGRETRAQADADAENAREQARQDAADAIADAEAKADRIVEEGTRRREDIEAVISDLVRRRDDVLADTEELSSKLTAAVSDHRPAGGPIPSTSPTSSTRSPRRGSTSPRTTSRRRPRRPRLEEPEDVEDDEDAEAEPSPRPPRPKRPRRRSARRARGPEPGARPMTEIRSALEAALEGGPERHRKKVAEQEKLPVRERVERLLDAGSFSENALLANWEQEGLGADGVVTGMGTVGGRPDRADGERPGRQGGVLGGQDRREDPPRPGGRDAASACRWSTSSTRRAPASPTR